jgi:hypothetical protein
VELGHIIIRKWYRLRMNETKGKRRMLEHIISKFKEIKELKAGKILIIRALLKILG